MSFGIALLVLREKEREEILMKRTMRRQLRDNSNPLEMPETLFQQQYRVNKEAFKYLLEVLSTALPSRKKSFGILPIVKLATCLRFFAEGGYQKGVGKDFDVGLAQSTVSGVLSEVLDIFESVLCPEWIRWPTAGEEQQTKMFFFSKYNLPSVIGCIDGTHVNIIPPATNRHLFHNRKGNCSLNVLLVCDHQLRINYIDATHPGACHDSFVWNLSELRSRMEEDYSPNGTSGWLLGDAGYPLEPWLLTPFRPPESGSVESKFNEVHSRCRNIIERTNGVLKNRWRCLLSARELYYSPSKAVKIINVCVALHNICLSFKSDLFPVVQHLSTHENENIEVTQENSSYLTAAQRIRSNIANTL